MDVESASLLEIPPQLAYVFSKLDGKNMLTYMCMQSYNFFHIPWKHVSIVNVLILWSIVA